MSLMVLNELEYAKKIIESQRIDENHRGSDLAILARYFIYQGKNYKEARKYLEEFCVNNIKYFNIVVDYHNIDYAINQAKKYKITDPINIIITHQEISSIQINNNLDYQRFLFTLLVLAKQKKYNPNKTKFKESPKFVGLYYNQGLKEVFKHAGLKWNENFKNKMLFDLRNNSKHIEMVIPSGSIILKFSSENGYPALIISDFRNIGLQYLKYIGNKKIGECQSCHIIFMKRSNKQILCKECSESNVLMIKRRWWNKNSD